MPYRTLPTTNRVTLWCARHQRLVHLALLLLILFLALTPAFMVMAGIDQPRARLIGLIVIWSWIQQWLWW